MAFSTFTGSFTQPVTTNATFAVTGTGFVPKAIILYATNETAVGISTNFTQYYGMATSTTNRASISLDQTTATNTGSRGHDDTKCFVVYSAAGTATVKADLVSFDANGFTLNFSVVDITARIINYIALGGADLTNAFIKEFIPAAANTAQSFTGVGFKPRAMFLMSAQNSTAPPAVDTLAMGLSLGFASAAGSQAGLEVQNNGATESALVTGNIIEKSSSGGSFTMTGALTTFDSDGFTITFSASSSVKYCFALCLLGGQYAAAAITQKTTTGSQATTGLAFKPTGVLMMSNDLVASASLVTTSSRVSFGSASGSANYGSVWAGGGNAGVQDNDLDTGQLIKMYTEGATPTLNSAATLTSFDSAGFTLNWGTADATARNIWYLAFGSNAVVAGNKGSTLMMMGMG